MTWLGYSVRLFASLLLALAAECFGQTPSPPSGVTASDGAYGGSVRVSWNAVSGAIGYQIFRNTTGTIIIPPPMIASVSGATVYDDASVTTGTTYFYWVKTMAMSGSTVVTSILSASDSGYATAPTLSPPTGVSASDGTYPNYVRVTWNAVSGNSGYEVYRNTTGTLVINPTLVYSTAAGVQVFDDTNVTVGTTYYYWVKTRMVSGSTVVTSVLSGGDSGYVSLAAPAAPSGVTASDGTYSDLVRISWNAVSGASGYDVFRSTSNSANTATLIFSTASGTSSGDDTKVTPGTTYYYWVKSKVVSGSTAVTSAFSGSDSGYASVPIPPAPTQVAASDGTYANLVRITWNAVGGAAAYDVYRNTSGELSARTLLASVSGGGLSFDDKNVTSDTTYYYWIKTRVLSGSTEISSSFSTSDTGFAASASKDAPPVITTHPASVAVAAGQMATFEVAATGSGMLAYSWRKNGVPIPGATRPSFVVPAVAESHSGTYDVVVSNALGTATSNPASLTLAVIAPFITVQPVAASSTVGQTVGFAVVAAGSDPLSYQWTKNGAPIAGATAASLLIRGIIAADAGSYQVTVANPAGTAASTAAVLSVAEPAVVSGSHAALRNLYLAGETTTVTNTITYSGAPASLAWQVLLPSGWSLASTSGTAGNVRPATGATGVLHWTWTNVPPSPVTFTYSLNVPASSSGARTLRALLLATEAGTSSRVLVQPDPLTLNAAPAIPLITSHPRSLLLMEGQSATLTVAAVSNLPLAYQWRKNGQNVSGDGVQGATSSTLTLRNAQRADSGSYTVAIANAAGTTISNPATVVVTRSYAGTYFGELAAGNGIWALVVGTDGFGTILGYVKNPRAGIMANIQVQPDGSFSMLGRAGAFGTSQVISVGGTITDNTIRGVLGDGSVAFSGEFAGHRPADPIAGLYRAVSASSSEVTYVIIGPPEGTAIRRMAIITVFVKPPTGALAAMPFQPNPDATFVAVTTGETVVDGGLGAVSLDNAVSATTADRAMVGGTINPSTHQIDLNIAPASGGTVAVAGGSTGGFGTPSIAVQPERQVVRAGGAATLALTAVGQTPLTYQWRKDGVNVAGATNPTFTIASTLSADAGNYSCVVSNSEGMVTSEVVPIAVQSTTRLSNISVRTNLARAQTLIVGLTVTGSNTDILLRAAGPALGVFGVSDSMADPKLELFRSDTRVAENNDWPALLAGPFTQVGAFPFRENSADAALLQGLQGGYSAQATGTGPGIVLVEGYDTTPESGARLSNLSARNFVGTGENILIVGFVVAGMGDHRVLIRAVGPKLTAFGLTDVLADPKLEVYNAAKGKVGENDNWDSSLASTFAAVGAFPLDVASKDAAVVVSLPGGSSYTVQVSGSDGGTGEALVELYELR